MGGLASRGIPKRAVISASALGDNQLVDAVPGKRLIVVSFVVVNSVATAQTVRPKSGASTNLAGVMALPSAVGGNLEFTDAENGLFETAPGEALVLSLAAATAVGGFLSYVPIT